METQNFRNGQEMVSKTSVSKLFFRKGYITYTSLIINAAAHIPPPPTQ